MQIYREKVGDRNSCSVLSRGGVGQNLQMAK